MNTVTHIAGVRLDVCGRVIQRCSLCGDKLCDSLNVSMPVEPDGKIPSSDDFPTWRTGALVQVTVGENPTRWSLLEDTDKLPKDSCISLVE